MLPFSGLIKYTRWQPIGKLHHLIEFEYGCFAFIIGEKCRKTIAFPFDFYPFVSTADVVGFVLHFLVYEVGSILRIGIDIFIGIDVFRYGDEITIYLELTAFPTKNATPRGSQFYVGLAGWPNRAV